MMSDLVGPDLLGGPNQVQQIGTGKSTSFAKPNGKADFDSFLKEAERNSESLKFSAHALKRIESRGIELTENDISRLTNAVGQAQAKGSRESLVLMDDLAAIVSVKNRTVVTILDPNNNTENIFTNIDSTVLVKS
ncbi:MAG: flagellar biosynthesis protein [Candidatus Coatesbacteria bacterium]|nr:flagellar biosynthesis protein [Candidatus Coatesbacteria bacterium]